MRPSFQFRPHAFAFSFLALSLAPLAARAQLADGDLDPSFWGDGMVHDGSLGDRFVRAVVVAPDDRAVVAGLQVAADGTESFFWRAFGDSGPPGAACSVPPLGGATGGDVRDAAFDSSGRLVLVGSADYSGLGRVVAAMRFLYPSCVLDPSFDGDGYRTVDFAGDGEARAVAIASNGAIVLAGTLETGNESDNFLVVRLLANGALDSSFDGDGFAHVDFGVEMDDRANALALQADGRIVVAGERRYSTAGQDWDLAVARLTVAGEPDPSFAGSGRVTVQFNLGSTSSTRRDGANALAIDRITGTILLAGFASSDDGRVGALARLIPGGTLDSTFSEDGRETFAVWAVDPHTQAMAVTIQDDARILVAASTHSGAGYDLWHVTRRHPNGTSDTSFGAFGQRFLDFGLGSANLVEAMTLHAGRVVVAGVLLDESGFKAALGRLWSSLVFADGFESGTLQPWTYGPP